MRKFVLQILMIAAVGTVLVLVVGNQVRDSAALKPISDAGDLDWFCYEERLSAIRSAGVQGLSHLCHGERSVKVVVDVEGLSPGEVYTTWMAYIEAPGACTATPCPLIDFPRLNPPLLLTRLDATVVDETHRATFVCTLRGLAFGQGSQIQLMLVAHGSALSGGRRAHQILGARWPERERNATDSEGVIARSYFTMRLPQD
jgi:hypothetical protein